ncbi:glucosamine-6-phosphate deaminase [Mycetocola reblochoni]|uniref:Glucosamine-6-phosphate deaminase n=2 Tax=Mycetocola reblochoni TaxID=331618 RepID=A0A1R4J219_9MICO|nr:glucosamine-6-phosphate deaminase [Mycetocola reblochoni]RLP71229.1 glucosamine-6-phosphate deaminase [Mycetocola reblochoni]SJN25964.1 Glucosamine-6-phosphate deaminase [Mycetocola reblochoni REB411]
MQIIIVPTPEALGDAAADLILRRADAGELRVLGVATGSSPVPVYRSLAERAAGRLSGVTAIALDEYVGIDPDHPESYHSVIDREVTVPLGLDPSAVHVPDGDVGGLPTAGERYEGLIRACGGVDVQILGIGATGHIGFNEPGSSLASRTRVKTLTPQTRSDNARFFAEQKDVPVHCVTQGLGTIMDAREVLLVAWGDAKSEAVAAAVEGPVTSMCPGSVLQMHPNATVIVDEAAAARLTNADYYRFAYANRPDWQR